MSEPTISCPNCHHEIKLTESLAAPLVASIRQEHEQKLLHKEQEFQKREATLRDQQEALAKAAEAVEEQVAERLKKERLTIIAEEGKKARTLAAMDLQQKSNQLEELQNLLTDREGKLAEAQKAQAEIIKKERALADEKREMELTIEKRLLASQGEIQAKAKKEAEGEIGLKVQEKEQTILAMQKQIEELRRKSEQGSQQLQGEVQELELEKTLGNSFPHDTILPVPKGEYGGDALQKVITTFGQDCGSILWESKNTKNWSDTWLPKLRDDQRTAGAEVAIIVTQALPKGIETFGQVEGVWVTTPQYAVPVAMVIRSMLMEVTNARKVSEGQQTKQEVLYQYLMGPRFRHRVEAIVERFRDMQEDLEKERRTTTKLWARRAEQIRGVIESTAGMYGDMQGIAGRGLQEIDGLELEEVKRIENQSTSSLPGED